MSEGVLHALEVSASNTRSEDFIKRQVFEITKWECGKRLADFELQNRTNDAVGAEMVSKLLHDAHSADIMKTTLDLLLVSVTNLQVAFMAHVDPLISKLSKGFASLPEELITVVFKYTCVEIGTKQAVWLSHVSRTFRRIALSEADLWTTLHSHARSNELETYISRSREADLHVVVNITSNDYDEDLRPFFALCFSSAARLNSISITALLDDECYPANLALSNTMMDVDHGERQLVFPRLRELGIFHYKRDRLMFGMSSDNLAFGNFSPSWDAPALKIIRCQDYIPTPTTPAFTSVTSFSLKLTFRLEDDSEYIGWLLEFLESASTLSDFDLEISEAERWRITEPLVLNTAMCPSITSFSFRIASLKIPRGTDAVLAPFMRSLQMPKLERLSFSAELFHKKLADRDDSLSQSYAISAVVEAALPAPLIHTRLTSLNLAITWQPPTKLQWTKIEDSLKSKEFVIPLDRIPFVTELSLSSNFQATFTGPHSKREYYAANRSCALRELRLRDCDYMDICELKEIVQSLKDFGAWDALKGLTLENCTSVAPDEALEVVGPERLTYIGEIIEDLAQSSDEDL
ncbi:hypothetical protein SCHPADRAFT_941118 [Schizopora paradoxa]|uniref:F-box domain-containing protein n=1 Tax=Schizopora paradoxa TaxID=27342 RepID=A0A0H2RSW8_9AGAM|nr:hypothetical protein SCHPADRAFT_941118 [Schizopora paradoxa]